MCVGTERQITMKNCKQVSNKFLLVLIEVSKPVYWLLFQRGKYKGEKYFPLAIWKLTHSPLYIKESCIYIIRKSTPFSEFRPFFGLKIDSGEN